MEHVPSDHTMSMFDVAFLVDMSKDLILYKEYLLLLQEYAISAFRRLFSNINNPNLLQGKYGFNKMGFLHI